MQGVDTALLLLHRPCSGSRAGRASPECAVSPHSHLSVPGNPIQPAQSQSSYNPFEDEDDTGSTVSEKEDIRTKKWVKKRFPLISPSLAPHPSLS